jgi:signal transduction histidine kinase
MEDKSKSLDAVLAKVAHELRTPLAVVHTTTNMLLNPKYQLTKEQVRDQHERIRRNAELMNRLIGEISDLAQLHAGTLAIDIKSIDVDDVLRDAVTASSSAASDKEIALTCHAASQTQALADRTRLLQLFQTLMHHAITSSASGSRISVHSKLHDGKVQVEITGSGLELSAEDLSNVFAPWRNGSGLGLFIGKGIVEAHGGQIACSSQPGAGTTFQVSLPLTPLSA